MKPFEYMRNTVTLTVDRSRCSGCGICLDVCPRRVLVRENGTVTIAQKDRCIECGACRKNCPSEAIFVDAGVGCAYAVIRGALRGTAPDCSCSGDSTCC